MNEVCPNFANPFLPCPEGGHCSLAVKVVRQQRQHREADIHWPTPDERMASMYILQKFAEMSRVEWVRYCRAEGN